MKNVLDKFQPPVKLHRQDPEATSPLDAGNTRQNEAAAAIASTSKATPDIIRKFYSRKESYKIYFADWLMVDKDSLKLKKDYRGFWKIKI